MEERIKNYMENVVDDVFDDIKGELGCCLCPQCVCDIKAIALNKLPPRYIVTLQGEMYMSVGNMVTHNRVEAMTALLEAGKMVSKRPRHSGAGRERV